MNALRKSRLTPLLVILFMGCVSINIVMYTFRDYMDANFGRGEAVILLDEEEVVPAYYRWKTMGSFLTEGKQEHAQSASTEGEGAIGAAGQSGRTDTASPPGAAPGETGPDEASVMADAKALAKSIALEGTVLLKNNGILPLKEGEILAPMGFHFYHPVYTGTGAGYVQTHEQYLTDFQTALKKYFVLNERFTAVLQTGPVHRISDEDIQDMDILWLSLENGKPDSGIYEHPVDIYEDVKATCEGNVALVVVGRTGDETRVFQTCPYADGTLHELALSSYEKDMIRFAKENCRAVVVVINSSNVMEIACLLSGEYECDAILWIGCPGIAGFEALADILAGKANPSGRTADIWETDLLSSPSMQNFGTYHYTNTEGFTVASNYKSEGMYFLEYAEGIYTGYRYFETASDLGLLPYGELDENGGILTEGAVAYPFGYGLSYSRFSQSIDKVEEDGTRIRVEVNVSNEGLLDGSEVVQLYVTVPYTRKDEEWGIEKSTKTLLAFDKVFVRSGESAAVFLSFEKEEMASYCQAHANADGTEGCYYLEEGEYVIWLGKNSHDSWDSFSVNIPEDIWYDNQNPRMSEVRAQTGRSFLSGQDGSVKVKDGFLQGESNFSLNIGASVQSAQSVRAATNLFGAMTAHMLEKEVVNLSRRDFLQTFPEFPEDTEMPEELWEDVKSYHPAEETQQKSPSKEEEGAETGQAEKDAGWKNPSQEEGTREETATVTAQEQSYNNLRISAMRGIDYDDPLWEAFLDQIDYSSQDVLDLLLIHSYYTKELEAVAKPASSDIDGPQGLRLRDSHTCVYPSEVVVASTFHTDLAYLYGISVGNEALLHGVNGWYAPGANLHRNAFGGRNFEYYSEDPLLSGKMAAACISGAASQGIVPFLKHFAMVNYEDHSTCLCVWATEQTMRELYFKSFEIAVKEAITQILCPDENRQPVQKIIRACTGVMASPAWLGGQWCAASPSLLTTLLREEWGFCGTVTTDMALQVTEGIIDKALRAGSDIRMRSSQYTLLDSSSEEIRQVFRRAVKNICYSYANSNLMQGLAPGAVVRYKTAPWERTLWAADLVVLILMLFVIRCIMNRKKIMDRPN